jgi:hypothetical protein
VAGLASLLQATCWDPFAWLSRIGEEEVAGALAIGMLVLPVVVFEPRPRRFLEEDGAMGGKVTATSFVTVKSAEPLCETMCAFVEEDHDREQAGART